MSKDRLETPGTPPHADADSEINLQEINSTEAQDLNLDLNSDMSDDDDGIQFEDVDREDDMPKNMTRQESSNPVLDRLKLEEGKLSASESVTSLMELNSIKEFATREEFDDGGFADYEEPRYSPINPFQDYLNHEESTKKPQSNAPVIPEKRRLSSAQQSRFVQYIDTRLLQIHRKFIKYLSTQHTSNEETELEKVVEELSPDTDPFTLKQLLDDLSGVLDFLWYSIFETKTIPLVRTSMTDMKDVLEPPIVHQGRLFGQTSYIIKIMGDLTDYILKYNFEQWHDLTDLLQFIKKIDSFISILIDQTEENNFVLIDGTERVRIDSIITRTKMIAMQKFEHMKYLLTSSHELSPELGSKRKQEESFETIFSEYEQCIGEIYEGIISLNLIRIWGRSCNLNKTNKVYFDNVTSTHHIDSTNSEMWIPFYHNSKPDTSEGSHSIVDSIPEELKSFVADIKPSITEREFKRTLETTTNNSKLALAPNVQDIVKHNPTPEELLQNMTILSTEMQIQPIEKLSPQELLNKNQLIEYRRRNPMIDAVLENCSEIQQLYFNCLTGGNVKEMLSGCNDKQNFHQECVNKQLVIFKMFDYDSMDKILELDEIRGIADVVFNKYYKCYKDLDDDEKNKNYGKELRVRREKFYLKHGK